MCLSDIPAVQAIERASFTTPWPPQAYRQELETNRLAQYLVVRHEGDVIAYGGVWLMVDEAHITTFAVHPGWRRRGIGERLLVALLDVAVDRGAREATLEVRLSNLPARRLYEKYGFRPVGLRPHYYTDDNEDALIMTTEPLASAAMRERLARLRARLEAPGTADGAPADDRREARRDGGRDAPPTPGARPGAGAAGRGGAGERAARPVGRELAATRRASRSSRAAAGSTPTSSRARWRSTPRPAGSCPRSPPARTCGGSCRSSTRRSGRRASAWHDVDAVAVT